MSQPVVVMVLLWSLLGGYVLLTLLGVWFKSWPLFTIAAGLAFVFGVAALASIGRFVLLGCVVQLACAMVLYRRTHAAST
jgi:hypothetical protein